MAANLNKRDRTTEQNEMSNQTRTNKRRAAFKIQTDTGVTTVWDDRWQGYRVNGINVGDNVKIARGRAENIQLCRA